LRSVDTLRVSVTDRCNLRCTYCMPPEGIDLIDHEEIMSFEEIERLVRVAAGSGVKKVRITGGEPLVRKGLPDLIKKLTAIEEVYDLPMTTNGTLLAGMAEELKNAGLSRVTVSLDTLKPERYRQVARYDGLEKVMAGIEAALDAGLAPVKINTVVVPGTNDDEVTDFAALANKLDLEVRFIERMPIVNRSSLPHCGMASDGYIPSIEIKEAIEKKMGKMEPIEEKQSAAGNRGPARVYRIPGGNGKIGFIAPMSEPFCKWCGRMRLTPDGKLRPCLAGSTEIDVKGPMRQGCTDEEIKTLFEKAVSMKPVQDSACFEGTGRLMSQIGG